MKVNVTKKVISAVELGSLGTGDGFIYDGYPHLVCESKLVCYRGFMTAINIRSCELISLSEKELVQPSQINVEYTI